VRRLEPEAVVQMREAVSRFLNDISEFVNSEGIVRTSNSQAASEESSFQEAEAVHTVQSQGATLVEVAGDHTGALVKMLQVPIETIAPWSAGRAVLEASALATWLLDPSIDVRTRVGRSLSFRYEGLYQQVKFLRSVGSADVKKAQERIDLVEQEAVNMGFRPVRDGRDRRNGIGQQMPSITDLVRLMLHEESLYRLASAVTHAHFWALRHLSFRLVTSQQPQLPGEQRAMQKGAAPDGIALLLFSVVQAFARALWFQCLYYGWNRDHLSGVLDGVHDRLGAREQVRFWKSK